MAILLFVLLVAIAFTWLVARSVRAGFGKGIFWFAWLLIGAALVLSFADTHSAVDRVLAQLWGYSLVGLPVWWAIAAVRRAGRRS